MWERGTWGAEHEVARGAGRRVVRGMGYGVGCGGVGVRRRVAGMGVWGGVWECGGV